MESAVKILTAVRDGKMTKKQALPALIKIGWV